MNMEEVYNKMVNEAGKDPEFRKRLLKDAKNAFKKIGVEFDDDIKVEVYQSTPDHIHFVLPSKA